jgi:hypothetical protein
MSGYAGDAILQLGATGTTIPFLPKPVTPRTLTKKVREVLDEPGSRTESAAVADTSRGIVG